MNHWVLWISFWLKKFNVKSSLHIFLRWKKYRHLFCRQKWKKRKEDEEKRKKGKWKNKYGCRLSETARENCSRNIFIFILFFFFVFFSSILSISEMCLVSQSTQTHKEGDILKIHLLFSCNQRSHERVLKWEWN